ncbi:MAG: hypothetical protein V1870_02895, partial [Candidatus Aenigmatarchaeota archaeon]
MLRTINANDPCLEWHEMPVSAFWFAVDLLGLGAGKGGAKGTGKPTDWGNYYPEERLQEMLKEGYTIGPIHFNPKFRGKIHF